MTPEPSEPPQTTTANVTIEGERFRMQCRVTVPSGPSRLSDLLPLARALSDAVVREACGAVEEMGEKISCRKGCGACCRQLIAISEVEARRIRDLVEGLPEPRRTEVRTRFAEACRRLEGAGLLEKLRATEGCSDEEYAALVDTYFRQYIPCPFLEEESCSIYDERPITCREHLVASPPEYCAKPDPEGVRKVRLPLRVFNAVTRWEVPPTEHFLGRWLPLILAPEWAEAHPEDPPPKPGPELLRGLLAQLGR
jgi:Fe-S-cluster containining protein